MQAAGILLVRADGSVLLQLRDNHAPTDANRWAIPGGLVNPGEQPEAAARREIEEEAGLTVGGDLTLFWCGTTADEKITAHVYCAATAASNEDIVIGEGQAMEFIPADKVSSLDLAGNSAPVVIEFLSSPLFGRLAPSAARAGQCTQMHRGA